MKRYGLIVADNGSNWFVSGAPDSRWNDAALEDLKRIIEDFPGESPLELRIGPRVVRLFDLANVGSTLAIQTQDLAALQTLLAHGASPNC